MTKPQVGEQIRRRRDALKLSMRDAAKRAGLSPTAWSGLEADKHPPTVATQRKVADALGWPTDWMDRLDRGELVPVEVSRPDEVAELRSQVADLSEQVAGLAADVAALVRLVGAAAQPQVQQG